MGKKRQDETPQGENSGESVLSLNTVFAVLSNQRRRTILSQLTTYTYPVPFEELVEIVAKQETETDSVKPSNEVYKQVAVDLYHIQLPKLADWGVIDYNENLRLIRLAETIRPLDEYLRLAEQHERHWQNGETPNPD